MITSKKDLIYCLNEEKKLYGFKSSFDIMIHKMGGSERAVIWGYQKQLRKTENYFNNGKRILFILNKIKLSKLQNKTSLHIPINTCDIGLHIKVAPLSRTVF